MCRKGRRNCKNIRCDGVAQTVDLDTCDSRPICKIKVTRIPRELRNQEKYCPNCRLTSRKQRNVDLARELRHERARSKKARDGQANNGAAGDSAPHTEVNPQAESSIMAESRGAVGGGFLPNSANLSSFPEEGESMSSLFSTFSNLSSSPDEDGSISSPFPHSANLSSFPEEGRCMTSPFLNSAHLLSLSQVSGSRSSTLEESGGVVDGGLPPNPATFLPYSGAVSPPLLGQDPMWYTRDAKKWQLELPDK